LRGEKSPRTLHVQGSWIGTSDWRIVGQPSQTGRVPQPCAERRAAGRPEPSCLNQSHLAQDCVENRSRSLTGFSDGWRIPRNPTDRVRRLPCFLSFYQIMPLRAGTMAAFGPWRMDQHPPAAIRKTTSHGAQVRLPGWALRDVIGEAQILPRGDGQQKERWRWKAVGYSVWLRKRRRGIIGQMGRLTFTTLTGP
jgi:hypothetical protein